MVAEFALALESPTQLLNLNVIGWRFKLPSDYWDRRAERVMAVTSAQVQAAARNISPRIASRSSRSAILRGSPIR